jgi:hypothetical protein
VVVDCVGEEDVDTHERIIQSLIVHPLEQTLLALYLTGNYICILCIHILFVGNRLLLLIGYYLYVYECTYIYT